MGEQKYEHTQNITLQRILQSIINLQSIHQDMDATQAQQVCVSTFSWPGCFEWCLRLLNGA
jgi:hypothetical protein